MNAFHQVGGWRAPSSVPSHVGVNTTGGAEAKGSLRARPKACTAGEPSHAQRARDASLLLSYHQPARKHRESKRNDLPGNAAARQEAVVLAGELRHGKVMRGRSWQGWFVSVVDQHGHQVDSVPIADMPDE